MRSRTVDRNIYTGRFLSLLETELFNSSPIWREDFNQTPEAIASLKTPSPAASIASPATSSVRMQPESSGGPGSVKQESMTPSPMPSLLSPFTSAGSPAGIGSGLLHSSPQIFTQELSSSTDTPRHHPIARTGMYKMVDMCMCSEFWRICLCRMFTSSVGSFFTLKELFIFNIVVVVVCLCRSYGRHVLFLQPRLAPVH